MSRYSRVLNPPGQVEELVAVYSAAVAISSNPNLVLSKEEKVVGVVAVRKLEVAVYLVAAEISSNPNLVSLEEEVVVVRKSAVRCFVS
jgi:hypothetical protein